MDKYFLFDMLTSQAADYVAQLDFNDKEHLRLLPEEFKDDKDIDDYLTRIVYEVNKRKLPARLDFEIGVDPEKDVERLRAFYRDDVPIVSALLGFLWPDKYLFYNPLTFEGEIFEGIKYFADVIPEFGDLDFDRVGLGKHAFDRYLKLNDALMTVAKDLWPDLEYPHYYIEGLLYHAMGPLFTEHSDYRKYWVMATGPDYFQALDDDEEVIWSGRKDMQPGDKIFVYRTSPVSAITDIFEVVEEPYFDPIQAWDGFWVKMKRVCKIPLITFTTMRKDPILSEWWVVRKQFTGTVTDPVSFSAYNRLLELIPSSLKNKHGLEPEPVAAHGASGMFDSEVDFEDQIITPLLKRLGIRNQRQYVRRFSIGTQIIRGRIDYVLYHKHNPYLVIENKLRILNDAELSRAVDQAKSYALQIGVERFLVAAPEGYWFYRLKLNAENLLLHIPSENAPASEELLAQHLLP
jgi:predicted RNA-binding protein with PUA-like domain